MNDVIFSTKGTKTAKIIFLIIFAAILILFALFIGNICPYIGMYHHLPDKYKKIAWFVILLMMSFATLGVYILIYAFRCGFTYVDVYRDKLVGKGLPTLKMSTGLEVFNIKNEHIINISMMQGWFLCIHTVSGKYYVMTNNKTGAAIMNHYAELKG